MITRRYPRSRKQRPFSLHTMRTFWMLLSSLTYPSKTVGAALAAVAAKSAVALTAKDVGILFTMSCRRGV
jgi:hypothetical protein